MCFHLLWDTTQQELRASNKIITFRQNFFCLTYLKLVARLLYAFYHIKWVRKAILYCLGSLKFEKLWTSPCFLQIASWCIGFLEDDFFYKNLAYTSTWTDRFRQICDLTAWSRYQFTLSKIFRFFFWSHDEEYKIPYLLV